MPTILSPTNNHSLINPTLPATGLSPLRGGGGDPSFIGPGGGQPRFSIGDIELQPPDYLSETSEMSELADILEEGEFRSNLSANTDSKVQGYHGQPKFNLESVGVPSVMPTVYDYQQYLKSVSISC